MPHDKRIRLGLMAGGTVAAAAIAGAIGRRKGFNLRGWALYQLTRALAPNISNPAVLKELIARDRVDGPARPGRKLLRTIDVREEVSCGMPVFRASRKGAGSPPLKLLYLHGGAFVLNLQAIQWNLIGGLLDRVDAEIIVPIYPLGPEAKWRETTGAIQWHFDDLAARYGAQNIMLVGDSSGGGLALLLAQARRDAGLPQPRALILYSPALDLSGSGDDQPALEKRDPALSLRLVETVGAMWLDGLSPRDPRVSALFADQHDLPPTIVFTGDREILHSDALRLKAINPAIDHRTYPEMMHVFPTSPLREARHALDETAAFIDRHRAG